MERMDELFDRPWYKGWTAKVRLDDMYHDQAVDEEKDPAVFKVENTG